jgi:hypothetical protein
MRCADLCELETVEGETPSPSAPPLVAIATTVHCMGTCPRKKVIPGTNRGRTNLIGVEMKTRKRVSTEPILA